MPAILVMSLLVGVQFGIELVGMAVCRLRLFAGEAAIKAILWRHGLWSGGTINQSARSVISTARQRP